MHHLELDQWEIAPHPGEQLGHQDWAQGGRDAEDDPAAGVGVLRLDLVARALDVAQDARRAFEQLLARLVSRTPRLARVNSATPSSSSRRWTWRVSAGWARRRWDAARVMLPSSAMRVK